MCPNNKPELEDWDEIEVSMQDQEETLLRGEEELDQDAASAGEEITLRGNKERRDDIRNILQEQNDSDQPVSEKDKLSDTTVLGQDDADQEGRQLWFTAKLDQSLSQKHNETESGLKTPQVSSKQNTNHVQTDGPFRQLDAVEDGGQEKPDKDKFDSGETGLLSHVYTLTEKEPIEKAITEWEDYLFYIWNIVSIISMFRFIWKYKSPQNNQEKNFPVAAKVTLPDDKILRNFYRKCGQTPSEKKWEGEFLEGFLDDLLDSMRNISAKNGCMVIGDFLRINKHEIIVPFVPPEPYSFQCHLCNHQTSDFSSHLQTCGQIKVVEKIRNQNGCPCQSSDADDMVCLLHGDNEKVKTKTVDACDGPFCCKSTPFLSKSQISRWFHSIVKQAWGQISHKYEFELNFRPINALTIRFRSRKTITFRMNPVVRNNDAHFFITPWSSNEPDTFWTVSLSLYEEKLLQHFSKKLPEDSCHLQVLKVAIFLHKRQTALTGTTTLNEFHFKTALIHLLLTKDSDNWKPNNMASRLRDLLGFIETSLERKLLKHALVGNPLTVIDLPTEFTKAKPVNLFHPLVVHECMHRSAVMHFQEMLRNAHLLIDDYTPTESTLKTINLSFKFRT